MLQHVSPGSATAGCRRKVARSATDLACLVLSDIEGLTQARFGFGDRGREGWQSIGQRSCRRQAWHIALQ